jgi:hypothetical protein
MEGDTVTRRYVAMVHGMMGHGARVDREPARCVDTVTSDI